MRCRADSELERVGLASAARALGSRSKSVEHRRSASVAIATVDLRLPTLGLKSVAVAPVVLKVGTGNALCTPPATPSACGTHESIVLIVVISLVAATSTEVGSIHDRVFGVRALWP